MTKVNNANSIPNGPRLPVSVSPVSVSPVSVSASFLIFAYASSVLVGRMMINVVPPPSFERTLTVPP